MATWLWLLLFLLVCAAIGLLLPSFGAAKKPLPYAVKFTVVRSSAKGNIYTTLAAYTKFKTKNGIIAKKLASVCLFDQQKSLLALGGEEQRLVERACGIIKRCDRVESIDVQAHEDTVYDFGIYKILKVTENLCGGQYVCCNGYYFVLPDNETRAYFNQEYSPFGKGG